MTAKQTNHALKPASLDALQSLLSSPEPRQSFNPGVATKLVTEGLVESVNLPSPFATHKGRAIEHFRITDAGRAALKAKG